MRNLWKLGMAAALVFAIAATVTGIVAAQTAGSTPDATATNEKPTATPGDDTNTPDGEGDAGDVNADKETRRDEYLDALADNLGVDREALDEALTKTALDMVDKALADGKITQEQADSIKERINSGETPLFGPGFGHGFDKGFHRGIHFGVKLEDFADFLGVAVADIHQAMMDGQSLAEVAEANGKSRDELKTYLTSNVEERLNQAVADGDITQAEADDKLQNFTDNLDELIDRSGPIFRGGPGQRGGPGHFERHFEDGSDTSTPDTETSALTL